MTVPAVAFAVLLPAAAVATGLVYADTRRRSFPPTARRAWTGAVALVSVGGFFAAFTFDSELAAAYHLFTGRPVVVTSPLALLFGLSLVGLVTTAAAVLAYGVGSRYGPLAAG
ncbi:hypothetical protein [Halorarius halobius]|uniref:hypothetical protein n=1 Tax=Halorarius halobius TaxID=2962671 RepID=UPI0020CDB32E|nr:hypothetical protein [Halorarius halobius]